MEYIAKSAWQIPNIVDKISRGAEGIEIQLLDPFKEECLKDDYIIPEEFRHFNIVCIHTPLMHTDNYEIDTVSGRYWLPKVVDLAEKIIAYTNRPMNIVCHMEFSRAQLEKMGLYVEIKEEFANIAKKHPMIMFNVENVIRLTGANDHVELVKEINLPNVKTTLDVCHAMMIEHILGKITCCGKYNNADYKYLTVKDIFEANKDVCGWIHLNNSSDEGEGFGYGRGHGAIFDENDPGDMKYLHFIHNLIIKYTPNATICLEVREDDFLNSTGYSRTRNACKIVFEDSNIVPFRKVA